MPNQITQALEAAALHSTGKPQAIPSPAVVDGGAIEEARRQLLNTPELRNFSEGVTLEALHQRERWGAEHDAGKAPADWFWLVGYLAGKALHAQTSGNTEKALHHTISTAAVLANWHAAITGDHTAMRPGIDPAAHGIGVFDAPAQSTQCAATADAPVAKPVAWANFRHDPPCYVPFRTREEAQRSVDRSEIAATQEGPYSVVGLVPVGTRPPAPEAAKDAARGVLRDIEGEIVHAGSLTPETEVLAFPRRYISRIDAALSQGGGACP